MSRKALMTIGLSILVGTGLGTTLTGASMTPPAPEAVTSRCRKSVVVVVPSLSQAQWCQPGEVA